MADLTNRTYLFMSTDDVEVNVDWELLLQSPLLVAMIQTIYSVEGKVEGPLRLHFNGKIMEKIFTFCDNHRDDWDYDDSIIDPSILLTDEDYDLLATDDEFTVHDQSALLEAAMDLEIDHLREALTSYFEEQAELLLDYFEDESLAFDLDDELSLEEEEEFRQRFAWILQA